MPRSLAARTLLASSLALLVLASAAATASASFGYLGGMNLNGGGANGDLLQFDNPSAVAKASDGSFFVADTNHSRIVKLDSNGHFVLSWGFQGNGDGQFLWPSDVDIAPDGTVFVADGSNNRVQWFNQDGGFLGKIGGPGTGSALGQFNYVSGLAIASDGSVYVADAQNKRVQHFTLTNNVANTPTAFGAPGSGDGQFNGMGGIDVDPVDGSVYVVDRFNYRVQHFDASGNFVAKFGGNNSLDSGMVAPRDVYVNANASPREVLVTNDYFNYWVQRWTTATPHALMGKWGDDAIVGNCPSGSGHMCYPAGMVADGSTLWVADLGNQRIVSFPNATATPFVAPTASTAYGGNGSGEGQMLLPQAVAAAPDGSAYVTDFGNSRVQHWSAKGELLATFGSPGSGAGQFQRVAGIAVAPDGSVFVVDYANQAEDANTSRVQKFTSGGDYVSSFDGSEAGGTHLSYARGISIDGNGNIFVADGGNYRIAKFDSAGVFLTGWGVNGFDSTDFDFQYPSGVAVDEAGDNVYVTDQGANRVKHFTGAGAFLGKTAYDGAGGSAIDKFKFPEGIAVDNDSGDVLVADTGNNRIKRLDALLGNPTSFGVSGVGNGEFVSPKGVAVDPHGYVWVADTNNDRVQRFGKEPTVKITSPTNLSVVPGGSGTLSYTVSDAGATCDTANDSPFGPLAPGGHTLTVMCENLQGANSDSSEINVPVPFVPPGENPPGTGPGTTAETILTLAKKVKLSKKRKLTFSAICPDGCSVTGSLKIGKKSAKMKAARLAAATGAQSVSFTLSKSTYKKVLAALKKKQKVSLTVTVLSYKATQGKTGKASVSR